MLDHKVFVVSTGQCGTRYITSLMQANGIDAVHEHHPPLFIAAMQYRKNKHREGQLRKILQDTRKDVMFEANWALAFLVPILADLYPEARFIFMHRDPRDYVRSHMSDWKLTPATWHMTDTTVLGPFMDGEFTAPRFLRSCRAWAITNEHLMHTLPGDRTFRLPFEDLIDPDSPRLHEVFDWLGVEVSTYSVDPEGSQEDKTWPPKHSWPRPFKHMLHWICGPTMQRLGYPLEVSADE